MTEPFKHRGLGSTTSICVGSERCAWKISASSATASSRRSSNARATSSGAACRASTRSRSSRRCSTTRTAAASRRRRRTARPGPSATSRTRTSSRRRSRREGGTFRVLDFAPRFLQHDRVFRPTQLFRIVEPLEGTPHIRVRLRAAGSAGPRRCPQGTPGLEPRAASRASRARCGSRPTCPLSYLDGTAVRAHRAPASRAHVGSARSRSPCRPLRPLPRRDGSLLATLGQALQHPAPLPEGGHSLGPGAQAPLLRGHRAPSSPR